MALRHRYIHLRDYFSPHLISPWLFEAGRGAISGPRDTHGAVIEAAARSTLPVPPPVTEAPVGGQSITEGEQVGYVDFDIPLGLPNPDYVWGGVLGSVIASTTGTFLPPVGNGSVESDEGPYPGAPVSDRPPFEEDSIYGPGGTWGEAPLPPDIYDIPYEDAGPDEIPPPPIPEEGGPATQDTEGDSDVAIDWGDFLTTTAQSVITDFVGGGSPSTANMPSNGAAPPAKVTVDTRTGAVTPCRRRRRRRLLTSSDLNDLAALKTIVGGGQALNGAVIKAVRR